MAAGAFQAAPAFTYYNVGSPNGVDLGYCRRGADHRTLWSAAFEERLAGDIKRSFKFAVFSGSGPPKIARPRDNLQKSSPFRMIPSLKLPDRRGRWNSQFALTPGEADIWMGTSVVAGSVGFSGSD
jgi:hypothetical protein